MMQANDFIKKLQNERTDYNHASQVKTLTNSLLQLATGIYTEPERFVYELLQNAVDAFADTDNNTLEILIKIEGNKFTFMHNGKQFSQKDVEGICDVGNGTKSNDKKKIGYKGIGFKSVFMPSVSRVSIKSGEFCFMFDKEKAANLMPPFPEGRLSSNEVPWQVIPIEQPELVNLDLGNYNVATIVESSETSTLADKVQTLFSNLQVLLFLSSKNINIRFEKYGRKVFSVGKVLSDCNQSDKTWTVSLLRDEKVQSEWLLHSSEIEVTSDVKKDLANDFNTPDKLKDAESVEISFAVQLGKDSVQKVEHSTVFTFLPTSYTNLNEPFLINANFITDASRQQLHQESKWNRLIFQNIPNLYLNFVAEFSEKYSNYVDILPQRYPASDSLTGCYRDALKRSFSEVNFVPNATKNCLLKINEILIDDPGICKSVIPSQKLFRYIEKKTKKHLTDNNLVSDTSIYSYVQDDYITRIGWKDVLEFFANYNVTDGLTDDECIDLIKLLYNYSIAIKKIDLSEFEEGLKHVAFLKNEANSWECPANLNFPSETKEYNEQAKPECILNFKVYDGIKNNHAVLSWLKDNLGINELTRVKFVEFILRHHDYITPENALEVGKLLFSSWKNDHFLDDEENLRLIKSFPFLTVNGDLKSIGSLYLGSKYKPEDDIESVYEDKSIFISGEYACKEDVNDWSFFFKQCGVGFKLGISQFEVERTDSLVSQYGFLEEAAQKFRDKDHEYANYPGLFGTQRNPLENIKFKLHYFSFIIPESPNYELDKYLFSIILSRPLPNNYVDKIWGEIRYWTRRRGVPPEEDPLFDYVSNTITNKYHSYLEYILANVQKFPTTIGRMESASDIYINSPSNLELGGKYLPILCVDNSVDESWRELLPFKREITTQDLLLILEKLSEDIVSSKDEIRKSVSKIYRELIERGLVNSSEIATWAKTHTLLSMSGDFLSPGSLNYITIDGFKTGNKVYCENVGRENREQLLQLLKTLGVKVITPDDIKPNISGEFETNDIKAKLEKKLQYIALIKSDDYSAFDKTKELLKDKISKTCFYKCSQILLTYGVDDDVIDRQTFSEDCKFYYIGDFTAAKIEPLLTPLCKFLGINNHEGELMVILLTEKHNDLVSFLSDKGYDKSWLKVPEIEGRTTSNSDQDIPKIDATGSEQGHEDNPDDEGNENKRYDESEKSKTVDEYFSYYSEKVKEFMGSGFSMPKDRILSEHIITRYRCLMYIKNKPEYSINPNFDEYKYIREESYSPIPLTGGQIMNVQGAKFGIWHLSPVIWSSIVEKGQYCCLCVGNREDDFKIIKGEEGLRIIANEKKTILVRLCETANMDPSDTLKSIFSAKKIVMNDGFTIEEAYFNRDVHAMLLVKDTPDKDINSMFDEYQRREHNNFDINWGS